MNHTLIASALTLLLGARLLTAQETTGDIRGRLRGSDSSAVAGAVITATGPSLLGERRGVSAADGVFLLLALPPGRYTVRIRAIGFRPVAVSEVPVQLGRMTGLQWLQLESTAFQLDEITIAAPRVTLDPVHATIGATLDAEDYATLPAERDYKSLIAILPHVNTSYNGDPVNAGGASGLENAYFIDGVNVTSPLNAATGTSLPTNFIRAVEVRTGGYEAQYGQALGAMVNAVTYTGTNRLESSFFAYFTNPALTASSRTLPSLRETSAYSYDVGIRITGPVIRDRLWFAAAYNPRLEHADRDLASFGSFGDHTRADVFAGKLTWQPTPTGTVELSVFGDPTTRRAVGNFWGLPEGFALANPEPFLRRIETGGVSVSLASSVALGSASTLQASVSRSASRDRNVADSEAGRTTPSFIDYVAGTIEGGSLYPVDVSSARTSATARFSTRAGSHDLLLGAEYEITRVTRTSGSGDAQSLVRNAQGFVVDSQFVSGTFRNQSPVLFVQDAWRLTTRLTVSAGMRWSRQVVKGASGATSQRFANEWQPRLGASLQLGAGARHRAFGAYGRYYLHQPLNLASINYVDATSRQFIYSTDPRQPGAVPDAANDYSYTEAQSRGVANGASTDYTDEFSLGYERLVGGATRVTVRAIRRELRAAFVWGFDLSHDPVFVFGTPGTADVAFLPPARRQYTAVELSVEGGPGRRFGYRASWVLSRNEGNYTGLYSSDTFSGNPGNNAGFAMPHQAPNSTGLLPNDRTHVFKFAGRYAITTSLAIGTFLTWQTGTPLSELGAGPFGPALPAFLSPRGSNGRTPSIADINLRLAYDFRVRGSHARCVLDILHIGNPRTAVRVDQQHFFAVDSLGNQVGVNGNFRQPIAYQPPMSARVGVELDF